MVQAVSAGAPNDLLDRLARHPAFAAVPAERLRAELNPRRYVGRAPEQVAEFLSGYLTPLLDQAGRLAAAAPAGEVRV